MHVHFLISCTICISRCLYMLTLVKSYESIIQPQFYAWKTKRIHNNFLVNIFVFALIMWSNFFCFHRWTFKFADMYYFIKWWIYTNFLICVLIFLLYWTYQTIYHMTYAINLKSIYLESSEMSFTCFIIITVFDLLM